jgi:hypothetical protein
VILLRLLSSSQHQYLRVPFFCLSVPVREVEASWELMTCYIKASHTLRVLRSSIPNVKWTQRNFGYHVISCTKSGLCINILQLEKTRKADEVMAIVSELKPRSAFIDVRVAQASKHPYLEESVADDTAGSEDGK